MSEATSRNRLLPPAVRRVAWTLTIGFAAYVVTSLAVADQAEQILITVFIGGATLIVQYLNDVDANQEGLGQFVQRQFDRVDSKADRREAEGRLQQRLLLRSLEEQIGRTLSRTMKLRQQEEPLVRELSHSLSTPLAQMEAAILASSTLDRSAREKTQLLVSVEVCKSFISAFREVATLARDTQAWQPRSLGKSISAATELYIGRFGADKHIVCSVDLPDSIPGYDNNFLAAVLLPLVENAVEASPDGGTVAIRHERGQEGHRLTVTNDCEVSALPEEIYDVHSSSKEGHEGLGLATVKTLLSIRSGTTIDHVVAEGEVRFQVTLAGTQTWA